MWFRKLVSSTFVSIDQVIDQFVDFRSACLSSCLQQGQGEASTSVQSGAEPRQVRSRWAEQLDPLIICANFSPSQMEEDEEEEQEEEEDFHPQSLESLLEVEEDEDGEEEKEVRHDTGMINPR